MSKRLHHLTLEDEGRSEMLRDGKDVLVVSLSCVLFLFSQFALSSLLFLCKVPLTWANAVISLFITLVFVAKEADSKIAATAIAFGLIAASVALVSFYYDSSWDGNAYHKLCAGLIKSGWNPIYQTFNDYANNTGRFLEHDWGGFYDGYPKASYIISASLYAVTGTIESGKAYTLLSMIGAVGSITVFLKEVGRIRWWQSFLVAFFLCFNTVSLGQVLTSLNDAFLSMLIFGTIFALVYLGVDPHGRYARYAYLFVFLSVILGVNLKFSALFPFTIICVVFFAFLLFVRRWGKDPSLMTKVSTGKFLAFYVVTMLCATVVLGLTSYVHNTFFYQNPMYPMIGKNEEDIIGAVLPAAYRSLPPIQQFVLSLFSSVSNDQNLASVHLKIPFFFNLTEVKTSILGGGGERVAGWGIWFSGILLVSLVAYGLIARKVDKKLNVVFLTLLAIAILPAFFIPALNNARYWTLPLLIPPFVLFLLFVTDSLQRKSTMLAVALLAANIVLPTGGVLLATKQSWEAHGQFKQLATAEQSGQQLTLALGGSDPAMPDAGIFHGMLFNLDDSGIKHFVQVKPDDLARAQGERKAVIFSVSASKVIRIVYVLKQD